MIETNGINHQNSAWASLQQKPLSDLPASEGLSELPTASPSRIFEPPNQAIVSDRLDAVLRPYGKYTDFDALRAAVTQRVTPSFVINSLKVAPGTSIETLLGKGVRCSPIDWATGAYTVEEGLTRSRLIGSAANFEGRIYVKEAASMLPPELAGIKPKDRVLDLCAAPGGKTLQAIMKLGPGGILAANEMQEERREGLRTNLHEHGVAVDKQASVFGYDARNLPSSFKDFFNVVLCDVPCTGLGILQRHLEVVFKHRDFESTYLPQTQERILKEALKAVKVGGTVVYSTCSMTLSENEGVIHRILSKYGDSVTVLDPLKGLSSNGSRWNLERAVDASLKVQDVEKLRFKFPAIRIWPHEFDAMGFFVCVLRRDS